VSNQAIERPTKIEKFMQTSPKPSLSAQNPDKLDYQTSQAKRPKAQPRLKRHCNQLNSKVSAANHCNNAEEIKVADFKTKRHLMRCVINGSQH
jgi:hypothetical protein